MHNASDLVTHYLRQLFVVMFILGNVFGIHHHEISMRNLFIKKTQFHKTFLFVLNKDFQCTIHCPYGYHIFVAGFEECMFERVAHPLVVETIPRRIQLYRPLCKSIMLKNNISTELKNLCENICRHKYPKLGFECTDDEEFLIQLLPLVCINMDYENLPPTKLIRKEIRKMYSIFKKESDELQSKFTRKEHFLRLLEDWIEIFMIYKNDFFADPEMTISILRKILYQYMVDHRYNHISFKSFDLSRMTVGLYLWSQWYEKLLCRMKLVRTDFSYELTWIGCLETLVEKDVFEGCDGGIHVYDFEKMEEMHVEIDRGENDRLCKTHPILRSGFLYKIIIQSKT